MKVTTSILMILLLGYYPTAYAQSASSQLGLDSSLMIQGAGYDAEIARTQELNREAAEQARMAAERAAEAAAYVAQAGSRQYPTPEINPGEKPEI